MIITSGGTESNHLAISGLVNPATDAADGPIVLSRIEHPSVVGDRRSTSVQRSNHPLVARWAKWRCLARFVDAIRFRRRARRSSWPSRFGFVDVGKQRNRSDPTDRGSCANLSSRWCSVTCRCDTIDRQSRDELRRDGLQCDHVHRSQAARAGRCRRIMAWAGREAKPCNAAVANNNCSRDRGPSRWHWCRNGRSNPFGNEQLDRLTWPTCVHFATDSNNRCGTEHDSLVIHGVRRRPTSQHVVHLVRRCRSPIDADGARFGRNRVQQRISVQQRQ